MKQKKRNSVIAHLGLFDRYNLAFFLSSIIPLGVLVYVSHKFILPALEQSGRTYLALSITLIMYLLVFLSILAFFVSRAATRETVTTLQVANEKLKNVFVVSESLSRETFLDVLLQTIVRRAVELTNAAAGIALIRNEETGELVFEVAHGTGSPSLNHVPDDTGVAGWVIRHKEVALINDVSIDDRYDPNKNILPHFDTGAILAVPLATGGKVFGALELLKTSKQTGFTDDDADLLKCLAGQTSIFIQNVAYREQQMNYFTHMTELLRTALEGTRQIWPDHLTNTARFAYLLGKQMGLSEIDLRQIHYASLLHDIGFLKLDLKDGPPRKKIELHPEIGYEMIYPITLWKDIAPLVRHHHERFDGQGYPDGLSGNDIPIGSRVIAVAETLDVLCNAKSYKRDVLTLTDAVNEIRAYSGTQYDPDVITALDALVASGVLTVGPAVSEL